MIITSNELRKEFLKLWPDMNPNYYQLYTDKKFEIITDLDELQNVLQDHHEYFNKKRSQELTVDNLFGGAQPNRDCDNWAKSCDAYIDEYYAVKSDSNYQRAFGKCCMLKVNGIQMRHTKCWCYYDGIFLVEPQIPEIKQPGKGDIVWFATTL
jgi:hypothetical protein